MATITKNIFVRTCQECFHKQQAKDPQGNVTDSYANSKCRKCKSESLDYGNSAYDLVDGKIVEQED